MILEKELSVEISMLYCEAPVTEDQLAVNPVAETEVAGKEAGAVGNVIVEMTFELPVVPDALAALNR